MSGAEPTILFLMRNLYYLRNFERPIRALAERGYRIAILADVSKGLPAEIDEQARRLGGDHPGRIAFGPLRRRRDFRRFLADEIHSGRDILRYYTPSFRGAGKLRQRAMAKASPLARLAFARESYWDEARNRRAEQRLARWDEALPVDRSIAARISGIAPQLLIVTPLVDLRSTQIDWVRAARSLGIPTVLAVASWDNLTSKSRIQVMTDRVLVWNEIQKREVVELHGAPADAVAITGAQLYDDWFERSPSQNREAFCRALGFDPARPIVLYAGSSQAIAGDEPAFVHRWIAAIRASDDETLRAANILVRPHPMNQGGYASLDVNELGPTAVHPLTGGLPVTERDRAVYFDSLHHCGLLVGLNTSALVEASILGKRCFTIRDGANAGGQEDTIHYHYLTAGRILHESADLGDHLKSIAAALADGADGRGATAAFVREFIRPHGLDVPATPIFADAVESAIALGAGKVASPRRSLALRIGLDIAAMTLFATVGALRLARKLARGPRQGATKRALPVLPESPTTFGAERRAD